MSDLNPSHGIISVSCEVACDKCSVWMLGLRFPKSEAEKELRSNGWKQVKGKWQCPRCSAKIPGLN